ncbi:hypothetical protein JVU11DRAFT_10410 [Chiua virens]|nr:hypothetical protein JVU11DRAFT_10410 [Chiua virens]
MSELLPFTVFIVPSLSVYMPLPKAINCQYLDLKMSQHLLLSVNGDPDTRTTIHLNRIPVELLLQILYSLNPEDVLALRQTCKYFVALTREPRLWTTIYSRVLETHPLGCSQSEFAALSPSQSERLLVRASKTEKRFQTSRDIRHHITPHGQMRKETPLVALAFLSERLLLSVDDTTVVYVWDISKLGSSEEQPSFPCARLTLVGWKFEVYSVSADLSTLYIILVKDTRAHIFSLRLNSSVSDTDKSNLSFRDEAYFDTHLYVIKSMDAETCTVILEASDTSIVVVNWRQKNQSGFSLLQDITGMFPVNYVLALRVCGPYILCFRLWSIDAYPIPPRLLASEATPAAEEPLPTLQHAVLNLRFSAYPALRFSRVHHSHSASSNFYTICVLVKDNHSDTLHYQVHVQTEPVPALSVRLLGFCDSVDRRIGAWDLGPSGLRGAWLRRGERCDWEVITFTSPDRALIPLASLFESFPMEEGNLVGDRAVTPRICRRMVGPLKDLEQVTECVMSEFTGHIALGSRTGVITLL